MSSDDVQVRMLTLVIIVFAIGELLSLPDFVKIRLTLRQICQYLYDWQHSYIIR